MVCICINLSIAPETSIKGAGGGEESLEIMEQAELPSSGVWRNSSSALGSKGAFEQGGVFDSCQASTGDQRPRLSCELFVFRKLLKKSTPSLLMELAAIFFPSASRKTIALHPFW